MTDPSTPMPSGGDARSGRPRVLAITMAYAPYVGGGYELGTIETVEELRARGFEVDILCGSGERFPKDDARLRPWLKPKLDVGDVWVHYKDLSTLRNYRRHLFCRTNYKATRRAIAEVRPDIVLYFNLGLVSLSPLVAVRAAGLPALGQISDAWPLNHWIEEWRKSGAKPRRFGWLERRWRSLLRRTEFGEMWLPSDSMVSRFRERQFEAGCLKVHPLPLPPRAAEVGAQQAPRARALSEPLRIVSTTQWWGGQGQHVLVDAVRVAVQRGLDVQLDLFGTGDRDYVNYVLGKAEIPELEGRVRVHGAQPPQRLLEALSQAHVFALPGLSPAPFGLETLEGMAHGLPVIATDAAPSPEIVRHERDGLVVPAGDWNQMGDAIQRLAEDEALRFRMAESAHERALHEYPPARYPRARLEDEPLRIVCTSMWWGGKGQHILVDAVRVAVNRGLDVQLDLFGDGDEEYSDYVLAKLAVPELNRRVTVHGRQPRARLFEVLSQAHVFAFPSTWPEPFGLATIEGMAQGLPVIGTDAGATPEIVRDGRDGLIVAAGDWDAMGNAIQRLAEDEPLRFRMAQSAHRRALADYSAASYYDTLAAALEARAAGGR